MKLWSREFVVIHTICQIGAVSVNIEKRMFSYDTHLGIAIACSIHRLAREFQKIPYIFRGHFFTPAHDGENMASKTWTKSKQIHDNRSNPLSPDTSHILHVFPMYTNFPEAVVSMSMIGRILYGPITIPLSWLDGLDYLPEEIRPREGRSRWRVAVIVGGLVQTTA